MTLLVVMGHLPSHHTTSADNGVQMRHASAIGVRAYGLPLDLDD